MPDKTGTDWRFRTRADLLRLYSGLEIPAYYWLPNGQKVRGEKCFLFFLRKLASNAKTSDLIKVRCTLFPAALTARLHDLKVQRPFIP